MTDSSGSTERKKVLFVIPTMEGGGAERFFSVLVRHLDRRRFEPHLGLLQAKGDYMRDIPDDVVIHTLNVSRVRYALPRLIRLVWKLRPKTILSTLSHVNLMLILARPFLPRTTRVLIQEAADSRAIVREETRHKHLWTWFYRHCYGRADQVLCLSESMANDMAAYLGLPREKLVSVYYPVDVERVTLAAEQGTTPYSGSGPHILAAGRMTRQKGFDILIAAMPAVLKHLPTVQLTILGQGPLEQELRRQVERTGVGNSVHFAGFQQNPWRYIKHAHAFVLPSRYEGLPNILLETLVLGTPIVASDCPGSVREVDHCGVDVLLVPPEDPGALAEAIIRICETPRHLRDVGVSTAAAHKFGLSQILSQYSRLL